MRTVVKKLVLSALLVFVVVSPPLYSADLPEVKKSNNGICHAKGSTYYSRTKKFTAYSSLAACIKSGGRMPKR